MIDKIYSNCPGFIDNIQTIPMLFSDHCILTCNFNTHSNNTRPRMGFKRDRHLLTEHTLTQYIGHNTYLNDIFHWNYPDIICDILHSELNVIINAIAPKKKIQLSKKIQSFHYKKYKFFDKTKSKFNCYS